MWYSQVMLMSIYKMSKILHKERNFICRLIMNNIPYVKTFGYNNVLGFFWYV